MSLKSTPNKKNNYWNVNFRMSSFIEPKFTDLSRLALCIFLKLSQSSGIVSSLKNHKILQETTARKSEVLYFQITLSRFRGFSMLFTSIFSSLTYPGSPGFCSYLKFCSLKTFDTRYSNPMKLLKSAFSVQKSLTYSKLRWYSQYCKSQNRNK